jgi:hypothetical protein
LTVFDYKFWFLQTFGSCVVCPSVIDGLSLPLLEKTQEQKFEETKNGNQRPSITEGHTTQNSKV